VEKRTFFIANDKVRRRVADYALMECLDNWKVVFSEPQRSIDQNDKFHAMITEISKVHKHVGRLWDVDSMKRLLVDEFSDEMKMAGTPLHELGEVIPSFDGTRIVQLGIQTRNFRVKEAAQFIEFLYSFAAKHNIKFKEF